MQQVVAALAVAIFLAVLNQKVVDYLAAPVRKRYPDLDLWWLVYVALGTGALLSWFAGANVFVDFKEYVPDPLVGRLLTCILVGGGSSLLNDVFYGNGQNVGK